MAHEVFALLDDAGATAACPSSRLYTGFARQHRCTDPATLDALWQAVQADQRTGLHAVLLADYEWGAGLIGAAHVPPREGESPALRLLMFRRLERLSADAVAHWLATQDDGAPAGTLDLRPSVGDAEFNAAIAAIQAYIAAGETYQVNYTYRLEGAAYGSPLALYRRLRERQPVPYGALIALPAHAGTPLRWVLSRSPELFLRHAAAPGGGTLTARPMKGTARRVAEPQSDSETARELAGDTKNRAENLMIVDLLRNDLGRVAQIGSVQVPELFRIEPYATLFQMTSTVQARPAPGVGLPALLRAAFPCGSITGAPKHHTMALIAGLESSPRGLYCGAIGWVDAPAQAGGDAPAARGGALLGDDVPGDGVSGNGVPGNGVPGDGALGDGALGDFCLSVAIRTLTLNDEHEGLRPLRLGVGAGIVQDSVAADERAECRLKARFLTGLDPGFELFETLYAEPWYGAPWIAEHLARLAASAQRLGFAFDAAAARARLDAAILAIAGPTRLRLALAHDGRLSLRQAPLVPLPGASQPGVFRPGVVRPDVSQHGASQPRAAGAPVRLLIAPQRLPRHDPLAAHKTTRRAHYDAGVQAAEAQGAFDSLFLGEDGRVVEGGRSNVLLRLDGCWLTPPVADGALPGVMRARLLADPWVAARECRLWAADLQRAEAIWVCNALRGVLPAVLHSAPASVPAAPVAAAA